ncbi:hypothetical protein C5S53_09330 [Methanophagales archaeon]|jgi:hypothetical protein|nr:hypothetical protein C5S53_09330 [Methanophagales archaeon]
MFYTEKIKILVEHEEDDGNSELDFDDNHELLSNIIYIDIKY